MGAREGGPYAPQFSVFSSRVRPSLDLTKVERLLFGMWLVDNTVSRPIAVDGAIFFVQDFLTMPRHENASRGLFIVYFLEMKQRRFFNTFDNITSLINGSVSSELQSIHSHYNRSASPNVYGARAEYMYIKRRREG